MALRNPAEVLLDMPAGSYKLACKGPDGEAYWIPCVKKHLVIRNAVEKLQKSAKDLKNEVEVVATREIWTGTLKDALALVDKAKAEPINCTCKRCAEKKMKQG